MAIGPKATGRLPRRIGRLSSASKLSAISDLSARLSHDFNNVLAAVIGQLELVERRLDDRPNEQARVQKAISAALQAKAVSQQLATFAAPRVRLEDALPIDAILHRSCERVRALGRTVEPLEPLRLWPVRGDESRLEAVLVALIFAAARDGGAARLSARNHVLGSNPSGDYVCIAVAGPGLLTSPAGSESDALGSLAVDSAVVLAEPLGGHVRLRTATKTADAECWIFLPARIA